MSTSAPAREHLEIAGRTPSAAATSIEELVKQVSAEVEAAEARVHTLQADAANAFADQELRWVGCSDVADRVHALLMPRVQAFKDIRVFQDIRQDVSRKLNGSEDRGLPGRTTTLTIPCSDKRPTTMTFSFCVGHDALLENVVVDYRLEILPIFVNFERHNQLLIPIDQLNEETVAAWISDRLVGFTRTYFEVYFHDEYQKKSLETDPVMRVRLPKAFAVGKQVYQNRTYYFFAKRTLQEFAREPSRFVAGTE